MTLLPKQWRYRAPLGIAVACLAWALFRMFEPVLTWSSGWQPLPEQQAQASSRSMPAWSGTAAQADALLADVRQRLDAPALSAAVMVDGEPVWAGAIGLADIESGRAADLETRFRIGSSSKAATAMAMGVLMQQGRVDIDKPVRAYLPELPSHYDAVTPRLAVSHRAGVPDYGLCLCFPIWEHRNQRHFDGVREALGVFDQRPLLFAPGSGFRYSSYGSNLVGAVLEAAAGKPYGELLDEAVFKPLGMSRSRLDIRDAADPARAGFYEVTEHRYKRSDPVDNSIRYPSGGLLSTPADMLLLGRAWMEEGRLLDAATRAQLTLPQKLADGSPNPQGYALGIRVAPQRELLQGQLRTPMLSHHGTAVGSTSYFAVYPEHRMVVSVMMNKGQENLDVLAPEATRLTELFLAEARKRR
ncbi:serine hydrolase domain-containing protein [Pelomonas sp. SE-A7]|uniref:serine hydrolase domain-containing protein n=1 Tax=Pelomonas sp. SE-A7 TaxID=3054953 RepID=UPI00259D2852|nr:serine hydrolase domain-containing protein [Pelomonas sp. SE-A7]MDM4767891.1 serine hydrolase domain-containing protein [Pelomonas sp. SE-A7]